MKGHFTTIFTYSESITEIFYVYYYDEYPNNNIFYYTLFVNRVTMPVHSRFFLLTINNSNKNIIIAP